MRDIYKRGVRNVSFRIEILDGYVSNGELKAESFSIQMDSEAEVKYSASLVVENNEKMDWQKNRIRIVMIEDGQEYDLGIFIPQYVSRDFTNDSGLYSVEAYDLSILAQMDCITSRMNISKGAPYITAIERLLISSGIQGVIHDNTDAVFQTDRDDWEIGTSKLKIVNQLLQEIGFRDVYINSKGIAVLEQYREPSAQALKWRYNEGNSSVLMPNISSANNVYEIPNIFLGIVSNPDMEDSMIYKYINDNPVSKVSTVYTGCNKVTVLEIDNIASQNDLEIYVKREAYKRMQGEETGQIETAIAVHGVNDVVSVSTKALSGIFEEISWSMDSRSMTMKHTLKKVIAL